MRSSELYDRDYYAWIQHQVQALRERRIEDVDWANAAEEIEDLGKSERRGIRSHLARLLEHLLKLQYSRRTPRANNRRGWTLSIKGARIAIEDLLSDSPSLRLQLPEMLAQAYQIARIEALRKARLSDETVPESSPWTVEQLMDDSFLPTEYRNK
ncbi:MAG: DUF29 domain-containing protein [Deltaproteobacteria bacterium]|nr:DUF29 domain-containing protein [Deltaproteobacteria bacterium]